MRISDWSSDVCSSDLRLTRAAGLWDCCAGGARRGGSRRCRRAGRFGYGGIVRGDGSLLGRGAQLCGLFLADAFALNLQLALPSVCGLALRFGFFLGADAGTLFVEPLLFARIRIGDRSEERRVGKSVSVRVDIGGRRIIKKKH